MVHTVAQQVHERVLDLLEYRAIHLDLGPDHGEGNSLALTSGQVPDHPGEGPEHGAHGKHPGPAHVLLKGGRHLCHPPRVGLEHPAQLSEGPAGCLESRAGVRRERDRARLRGCSLSVAPELPPARIPVRKSRLEGADLLEALLCPDTGDQQLSYLVHEGVELVRPDADGIFQSVSGGGGIGRRVHTMQQRRFERPCFLSRTSVGPLPGAHSQGHPDRVEHLVRALQLVRGESRPAFLHPGEEVLERVGKALYLGPVHRPRRTLQAVGLAGELRNQPLAGLPQRSLLQGEQVSIHGLEVLLGLDREQGKELGQHAVGGGPGHASASDPVPLGERRELPGELVQVFCSPLGLLRAGHELRRAFVHLFHGLGDLVHADALLVGGGRDLLGGLRCLPDGLGQAVDAHTSLLGEDQPGTAIRAGRELHRGEGDRP